MGCVGGESLGTMIGSGGLGTPIERPKSAGDAITSWVGKGCCLLIKAKQKWPMHAHEPYLLSTLDTFFPCVESWLL